ncbi:MAG TPA: branched-chain amino acid ABC transporter ATP-binding protein/permease [Dermatophilaceae bacterium]|nr:branched-chain amino acid ABC transporter ATP-binding protein/permease [Dermatophilaceae bacterium]HQK61031.1 branched-chain amino acid ABC transporter ATP-binding protein/permease [Dermatophilaceae bacterium]
MNPLFKRQIPFIALLVGLLVFGAAAPQQMVDVGIWALIYGFAAIGLSLLMGLAGQVSLGHAAFIAVGAYTQALLVAKANLNPLLAAPISVVAAMLVALLVGLPLLRLRGHFLALATLGLGIIVGVFVTEQEFTGGTSGIFGLPNISFGGRVYDTSQEYFLLLTPVVVIGLWLASNLVHSRTGRALSAVNDSEVAAECLGVDTFALRLRVFVVSAGYAGLAGVFYTHWLTIVNPSVSHFELSVKILLMVVLGGLGTVWGALIGAVAVQLLDDGLRGLIPILIPDAKGEIQLIGFGVVLVLVIILMPGGLAQLWARLMSAVRQRKHPIVRGEHETPVSQEEQRALLEESLKLLARAEHMPAGQTILAIRGLTKRYGGVTALDNLDLDVKAGEIMALIGPNGAGKTTAFNMITGVMVPTEGSVLLQGTEVAGKRPHIAAEIGATRTFQNLQTFKSTTVIGNVKVARHLRSKAGLVRGMLMLDRTEERLIDQASQAAIDAMGLTNLADKQIADLAFGKQRQVEVARALALEPSVLLLDEPMAGLSGPERDSLSWLLRRVKASGVTVLLVEHDVAAVMALADRVAVLDDGKLISLGTPAHVTSDPKVIAAYLGEEDDQSGGPATGAPTATSGAAAGGLA